MSKRRKKTKPRRKPSAAPANREAGLWELYHRACELVQRGEPAAARTLYETISGGVQDRRLRALVANDLGSLALLRGDTENARKGFLAAIEVDHNCEPAKTNLALVDARSETDTSDPPTAVLSQENIGGASKEAPIRLAVVSFLFNWPSTGGGNVHTAELCRFLAKAGYDVLHLFVRFPDWGIGRVTDPLPYPHQALEFSKDEWNVWAVRDRVQQAVAGFDPDQVLITDSWNIKPHLADAVRDYPYILRLQAMECLCPLNNLRLLADDPDTVRQCTRHQLATREDCLRCLRERGHHSGPLHQAEREFSCVWSPNYHTLLLESFRRARAVLVVNPLHQAMIEPYAECVRVVTSGMDPARFPWPPPAEPARDPGKRAILFAGLVEETIKGFRVVHEACARLWKTRQDFELMATGDPPGRVDEFTRFVGWQSQNDLPRYLRTADLLVMPTIAQEALGRTAVEAMAAGRPVVASRLGGLPFTVVDGATGVLCEPGDSADLAAKIGRLLDDPDLRKRMGEAGRRRFEEHYSWDVIIEKHYRPLLTRRDRGGRVRNPSYEKEYPHDSTADRRSQQDGAGDNGVYHPHIPSSVPIEPLLAQASRLFGLPEAELAARFRRYQEFSEAKRYAERLGEFKTLCLEEAFLLALLLAERKAATVVEIGTHSGRATRRLLDLREWLRLFYRVVCFGTDERPEFFSSGEAELNRSDLTGRFPREVLDRYPPGVIFTDVHGYPLLKEFVTGVLAHRGGWALALHDCGPGLCNPHMTLAQDDPAVTSRTGVWERHVLAETFGVADPLSERLNWTKTDTHRLCVFETPHGLGVVLPKLERE